MHENRMKMAQTFSPKNKLWIFWWIRWVSVVRKHWICFFFIDFVIFLLFFLLLMFDGLTYTKKYTHTPKNKSRNEYGGDSERLRDCTTGKIHRRKLHIYLISKSNKKNTHSHTEKREREKNSGSDESNHTQTINPFPNETNQSDFFLFSEFILCIHWKVKINLNAKM